MSDIYDTRRLASMAMVVHGPDRFLLDNFFKRRIFSNEEMLDLYTETETETMANFVAPCVESDFVTIEGSSVKSIKPAYLKDKTSVDLCDFTKRLPDEPLGGSLSPAQRRDIVYGKAMQKLDRRFTRREEWMAASVLVNGTLTISGEKYPTVELDFGRDATNSVALSGADLWSASTSSPKSDLQYMSEVTLETGGAAVTDYIMDGLAWGLLQNHQEFIDTLNSRRGVSESNVPNIAPRKFERAMYLGMYGEFRLWLYSGYYKDELGAKQKLIPDNTIVGIDAGAFNGAVGYGAIKDHDALYATPRFSKMWKENDPSDLIMQLQSAPIVFPGNINASCVLTVA